MSSLLRKLLPHKPPDGLLYISHRIYVFDCCFVTESWEENKYKEYLAGIVSQLQHQFLDAALLVFNFRNAEEETPISKIFSEYDMTVMDYPGHYEGCPVLSMGLIHHILRSTESWLALRPHNVLLLHCEKGGWPVLAFMLAALMIYRKQYTEELRTLDMVYEKAPRELLPMLSHLNPIPSQLRYLQYVARRNVASQWPPLDRALMLDCIIFRKIPDFNGEGGFRPFLRIYGQDPLSSENLTPKLLFSTQVSRKAIRLYKQAESELVKIDIHCYIQGDVVLECTSLRKDMEHEDIMFRIMFNTAFIRSNILMLNRDEIDTLWDTRDQFPKDFRAEVLFSDMDDPASVASVGTANLSCFEEKGGLPMEAFAKVQEFFSHVDWPDLRADAAQTVIQKVSASHSSPEYFVLATVPDTESTSPIHQKSKAELKSYIFCKTKDQDTQDLLCNNVLKDYNPGQQKPELNNFQPEAIDQQQIVAALCSDMKMLSATLHATQKKDVRSPNNVKGGEIAAEVSVLSETTPMVHLPFPSSPQVSTCVVQENARYDSASFDMKSPQHAYVAGLEVDVSCKDALIGPKDSSQSSKFLQSSHKFPILRAGLLAPSATVEQSSIDPIHEDSRIISKCRPTFSSPSEASLRKARCSEIATSLVTPRLHSPQSTVGSSVSPSPSPPTAADAVPLHPPKSSLNEKSTIGTEIYLSPHSNVSAQTSKDKLAETEPPPSQLLSPLKDSANKSGQPVPPPPPPLPHAPPLKENSGKSGPPPPPLLPQESGSSRSFSAPPPPPPPRQGHQSQPPQVSPAVPFAPPPPKVISNKGTTQAPPAPPLSSLNAKGRSFSRSLGPKNSQTKKLKPLHWLKLPRAVHGSLWEEAQRSGETSIAPEIDMSELENLFSASVPNTDKGTTGGIKLGLGAPKSDLVQLIDHRRAYNCEIMLSRVKVPLQEMTGSILSLDDSSLDIDQVENLIKFCPTKEEMELLKGYTGEVTKLGKCEQFFLGLMRVPRIEGKLRVFSFKMQFCTQVSDLRKSLNIVNSAANQIRSSVKFRRIMQTVLSLGNALNQGTTRGSAVGFRLDSLLKLCETHAHNYKMTLMHYLCKVITEKLPELLDFSKDVASIEPATKIQLKFLAEEMQAINKGLEKVVEELAMSDIDGPVSDEFRKNLKEFLCFAEGEVRSVASVYSSVGRNVDALVVYFGEDPARCSFGQVVTTLCSFTRMFNRAHEENCKQHELEKKKSEKELGVQRLGAQKES